MECLTKRILRFQITNSPLMEYYILDGVKNSVQLQAQILKFSIIESRSANMIDWVGMLFIVWSYTQLPKLLSPLSLG